MDWAKWDERVPPKTRIRYDMQGVGISGGALHVEGWLTHPQDRIDPAAHRLYHPSGNVSSEEYDYPIEQMEYLIDDQWLTFEQVME
jgi:hypothetical protein